MWWETSWKAKPSLLDLNLCSFVLAEQKSVFWWVFLVVGGRGFNAKNSDHAIAAAWATAEWSRLWVLKRIDIEGPKKESSHSMGRMQGLWSYLLTLSLTARIWCSELVIQRTGLPIACLFSKRGCLLSIMIVFSVMSILSEVSEGVLFSNIDKLLFTWNGACLPQADKFKHKTWRCSLESQTEILMWRSQKGTRSFYDGERFKNCEMGDISF